ncbi:MAG: ferrous iron transporter B [Ruminococcaceae bacterium]|nr:ferrous iron transporter B [Oscillospiraceae bacterium]
MSEKLIRAALLGNPNVGKSTVFNALTGMKQHTGNWAGKTVGSAEGKFTVGEYTVLLTDLPGIYSLRCHSPEEEVSRDHIESGKTDVTVCVCDALSLERNLLLVRQAAEICDRVIICVNLIDEAEKKGVKVDSARLSEMTGCPVVLTAARQKVGLSELKSAIVREFEGKTGSPEEKNEFPHPSDIVRECVHTAGDPTSRDRRIDSILTGKYTAIPVMLLLLAGVFWLTLVGSGYLSGALGGLLDIAQVALRSFLAPRLPTALTSLLCDGLFATVFRVVAVMLPPMAIFFPFFTLLEDLGYLPRVAFNLDRCFKGCGSCGKQSLTMLMGLGCNAAGVTGCRIIDSPRERLIAIITNSFIPCNGRLPLIIAALGCLGLSKGGSVIGMLFLLILSVAVTLGVSKLLSVTLLRGEPSSFTLELPPYRAPQVGKVIVRSVFDRTLFVLGRAVSAAAPAGILIWLAVNISVGTKSIFAHLTDLLDPVGRLAGMDGVLMLAFILALPAAELMLPLAITGISAGGLNLDEISDVPAAFAAAGWSGVTVVCVIIFMMFHFPCATTLMTTKKETGSIRWTLVSAVLPTLIGYLLCVAINLFSRLFIA